jgi:hypothetical protein
MALFFFPPFFFLLTTRCREEGAFRQKVRLLVRFTLHRRPCFFAPVPEREWRRRQDARSDVGCYHICCVIKCGPWNRHLWPVCFNKLTGWGICCHGSEHLTYCVTDPWQCYMYSTANVCEVTTQWGNSVATFDGHRRPIRRQVPGPASRVPLNVLVPCYLPVCTIRRPRTSQFYCISHVKQNLCRYKRPSPQRTTIKLMELILTSY